MAGLPQDWNEPVPQTLDEEDSREYERRVVAELRRVMMGAARGLVEMDEIELIGSRPETRIVFRYHHRDEFVGRHPSLVGGRRAEVAALWQFAIDEDDPWSRGLMDSPKVLAAAIGSAFDAAELELVDPDTLVVVECPPNIFPR